jgi:spore coat polysaccharide biosynthesis protein SpsF
MTIGVIIQARMGSARLPGKVLRKLNGLPILGHIFGRLCLLQHEASVVVASSVNPADDAIAAYCTEHSILCFRGSQEDVLARYVACAEELSFAHIARLTGDNPFIDIDELDRLIALHLLEGNDYSHSIGELPIGVGAELFTLSALQRCAREGEQPHHREHVNEYILENPALFKVGRLRGIAPRKVRPQLRLTVDTEDDFRRACFVAEHAQGRWASTEEAIALCSRSA